MKKTIVNFGTQYYRAPFPDSKYWDDDFRKIRDSGLNTVQLWVLWAWVEAVPGRFVYDDYDLLIEMADKHGLQVVLSTIAEIQPYWIHREAPGSEMITNMGIKVISSNRSECHFGLTPGGCTDHPEVWKRMRAFLQKTGQRYCDAVNLAGWDIWNELRWNVQADGMVCYCKHSLQAYRDWLDRRHGGLDGLNAAWNRRYSHWEDVMPGKTHGRPYTEMMAWQHFITHRADRHGKARFDVIKNIDRLHPVTLHGSEPSPNYIGGHNITSLDRGNDWNLADGMDGIGCSSFPKWNHIDDADFGMRIELVRSAARGKRIWLSELQGGRSARGLGIHEPVDSLSQQRWVWNGLACGANTILFWCWRDEVFGNESGGFGISGLDGLAEERLEGMRMTGGVLKEHGDLFDAYRPEGGRFGVLFSPQSYYYYSAQEGSASKPHAALRGVCRALVRRSIPFTVIEEEHLDELSDIRVIYLPRATALTAETRAAILEFVREGGTLAVESECGAFCDAGLYRYPQDRFLAEEAQLIETGRRRLDSNAFSAKLGDKTVSLPVTQWLTPLGPEPSLRVHATGNDGILLGAAPLGAGKIVYCASYPSEAYAESYNPGFEEYIEWLARGAGCAPEIEVIEPRPSAESFLYVKYGSSAGKRIVFVFFQDEHESAHLQFRPGFFRSSSLTDLISGEKHRLDGESQEHTRLHLSRPPWRFAVLTE